MLQIKPSYAKPHAKLHHSVKNYALESWAVVILQDGKATFE